jgi:hypothetical protein
MITYFKHCINPAINWLNIRNKAIIEKENNQKTLTLFFFKLYTTTHIIDITPILQFLEVSIKEFTSVGAKLILNTNDDTKIEQEFRNINILNFNPTKKSEFEFVQEVILSFDSILRFTSLEMWNAKSLADRKATASEHLEASLKADDITNTTELIAETITKAKHKINNKNELQSNLELRMSNLEKMLAKQQQQKNYKGGRPEHRSSYTTSIRAPPQYKSYKQHNRNNINLHKDHHPGQLQTMNQLDNDSESLNPTKYKQKSKHSKPQKIYPQDQLEFKKRKIDTPNNTSNKKRKIPSQPHEETSDSHSLTSQSTTSELSNHPWNNQRLKKQTQKNQNIHDVRHREQNTGQKRKKK